MNGKGIFNWLCEIHHTKGVKQFIVIILYTIYNKSASNLDDITIKPLQKVIFLTFYETINFNI